jgi:hypothetical protein
VGGSDIAVVLVASSVAIAIGWLRSTWRFERVRERWRRIALERAWHLAREDPPTLHARIGAVAVTIEAQWFDDGPGIRFAARSAVPSELRFSVRPRGHSLLAAFVGKPLRLGEPFDSAFAIESSDDELARAWFARDLLRRFRVLAGRERAFALVLSDEQLVLTVRGAAGAESMLAELAELVAAVAEGGGHLCERWRELARELRAEPLTSFALPPPPIVVGRAGQVVRVELVRDQRCTTRVDSARAHAADGARGETHVDLPGIVLDAGAIEEAIEDCLRRAQADAGPYR